MTQNSRGKHDPRGKFLDYLEHQYGPALDIIQGADHTRAHAHGVMIRALGHPDAREIILKLYWQLKKARQRKPERILCCLYLDGKRRRVRSDEKRRLYLYETFGIVGKENRPLSKSRYSNITRDDILEHHIEEAYAGRHWAIPAGVRFLGLEGNERRVNRYWDLVVKKGHERGLF